MVNALPQADIGYTRASQSSDDLVWEIYLNSLPLKQQQRILGFRHRSDRRKRILSLILLRHLFDPHCLNFDPVENIQYSKFGKPYLLQADDIDISFSYSNDIIACAIFHNCRGGLDIERKKKISIENFSLIFPKIIWKKIILSNSPYEDFFYYWTILECLAKAEGFGLYGPLEKLSIEPNAIKLGSKRWYIRDVLISDNYVSQLVVNKKHVKITPVQEIILDEVDLL